MDEEQQGMGVALQGGVEAPRLHGQGMQLSTAPSVVRPSLGRIVLVRTHRENINGQEEHAALVTQVWSDVCINLTAFPGSGSPRGFSSVLHESQVPPDAPFGSVSWRWPPRV